MDIWIVIVEDRHVDVNVLPFSTEEKAIEAARAEAPDDAVPESLDDVMVRAGWVYYLPYGTEGDSVRVVKRTIDNAYQ